MRPLPPAGDDVSYTSSSISSYGRRRYGVVRGEPGYDQPAGSQSAGHVVNYVWRLRMLVSLVLEASSAFKQLTAPSQPRLDKLYYYYYGAVYCPFFFFLYYFCVVRTRISEVLKSLTAVCECVCVCLLIVLLLFNVFD